MLVLTDGLWSERNLDCRFRLADSVTYFHGEGLRVLADHIAGRYQYFHRQRSQANQSQEARISMIEATNCGHGRLLGDDVEEYNIDLCAL